MSITVTGATGQLGRLIVESLLRRGVPPDQIVAVGRNVAKAADLADRGVVVVPADYDDVDSLRRAFAGTDELMFVSGYEAGKRAQHRNVIGVAKDAGVGLVAYTSIAKADRSTLKLAADHRATEQQITAAALPYVFCATVGTWRTTPPSCRHTWSTASSARPATARSVPPPALTSPRPPRRCSPPAVTPIGCTSWAARRSR